jgi:4-hydroxy-tetrahydrodipicolinate synthase
MTSRSEWGRLLTAMVTPMTADGQVNLAEAQRLAAHLVDEQGNDGIVVSGTTGESPTLTDDEKLDLLDAVREAVGDRAAIVFGSGSYDTQHSIHLSQAAEKRGCDGLMLVNPYYSRPGQAGLYAHFAAVAEATTLPIMVYNIQPRSAINLDTPTLMRLVENYPRIAAVKEASGNMGQISDVCRLAPSDFRVYSGDDGLTLPILAVGGYGLVSVAAHMAGRGFKAMIECFSTDPALARRWHHALQPAIAACFCGPNPSPLKSLLADQGFETQHMRLPVVPLSPEELAVARQLFAQYQPVD